MTKCKNKFDKNNYNSTWSWKKENQDGDGQLTQYKKNKNGLNDDVVIEYTKGQYANFKKMCVCFLLVFGVDPVDISNKKYILMSHALKSTLIFLKKFSEFIGILNGLD